jgi:hypothetical protein
MSSDRALGLASLAVQRGAALWMAWEDGRGRRRARIVAAMAVEVRHLEVGGADPFRVMRVGAGTAGQVATRRQVCGSPVELPVSN